MGDCLVKHPLSSCFIFKFVFVYKEDLAKDDKLLEDVMCNSSFSFMKEHFNKQIADMQHLSKEEIRNNTALSPGIKDFLAKKKDTPKKGPTQTHFVRKGMYVLSFKLPSPRIKKLKVYQGLK